MKINKILLDGYDKNLKIKDVFINLQKADEVKKRGQFETITVDLWFGLFGGAKFGELKVGSICGSCEIENEKDLKIFKISQLKRENKKLEQRVKSLGERVEYLEKFEPDPEYCND